MINGDRFRWVNVIILGWPIALIASALFEVDPLFRLLFMPVAFTAPFLTIGVLGIGAVRGWIKKREFPSIGQAIIWLGMMILFVPISAIMFKVGVIDTIQWIVR